MKYKSFNYEQLIQCAKGMLFGKGNAQLPMPPMLMFDRITNINDVGGAALFLLSNLASGTTGEVLHVDSGYHIVGMKSPDAPDISVV